MYFEEEINTHREGDNESNLIDCQQVTIAICTMCMCIHQMQIVQTSPLGVPATSRILTGDSQKFSFSILIKVPFLIF